MKLLHLWRGWFFPFFIILRSARFSNGLHWLVFRILRKEQSDKPLTFGTELGLRRYLGKPARAVFTITCAFLALPFLPVSIAWHDNLRQTLAISMVLALGWFIIGLVYVLQNVFLRKFDLNAADNVQARRVHTQFQVFPLRSSA